MTASSDEELFDWIINAAGHGQSAPAGSFLRHLAESALHADPLNYPLLRPVLLAMKAKYPDYDKKEVR